MGGSAYAKARAFKFARRTSADLTPNGTNWANLDTGLDLTLPARVGDVLQASLNARWSNEAVDSYLDAVTLVSAAPVNSFGKAGAVESAPGTIGVPGWFGPSGVHMPIAGPAFYTVVSGDLASGFVTVRLRVATASATARTLRASTTSPLTFALANLGPADDT